MVEIRKLPVAMMKPAPYNPRRTLKPGTPGYEKLARSLQEFDLVQPIVWNEFTGHVVGGHQRLQVLRDRGETEVLAAVVSLSLEREKLLNVALNNAEVGGDWDQELLTELLAELRSTAEIDATLTGFDEQQMNDMMLAPVDELAVEDEPRNVVEVVLEIDPEDWPDIRPELDTFVAGHRLRAHISEPQ